MTNENILGPVKSALRDYETKYRHPDLPALELSEPYGLFPGGEEVLPGVRLRWPATYPNSERKGVYLLLGRSGRLLYVGKASMGHTIGGRLGSHFRYSSTKGCETKDRGWSEQPVFLLTVAVPEEMSFEAAALEEYLIKRLNPSDNATGKEG